MKTILERVCLIGVFLSLVLCSGAQTLNTLVSFTGGNGLNPQAGLVGSVTTLYGTAFAGGASNYGTIFLVNTNGSIFSNMYSFVGAAYNTNTSSYVTTDGAYPGGGLVLAGSTLYGTTENGGSNNAGTVFAINTNGGNYAILHHFLGGNDGANPDAGLALSGATLYGTTFVGGKQGQGSVFRIDTNGNNFTNIYSFTGGANGANPEAPVVVSGNTLFGTTYGPASGQGSGYGTVFRVNSDGSSFSNVYTFTGGADGANPMGGLVLSGSTLYGTAYNGGVPYGLGTVFDVNTNGSYFVSYGFSDTNGANPAAGLILDGGTLFGTTENGGSSGFGTIFEININGANFNALYSFTDLTDGSSPESPLALLGTNLFGTTQSDNLTGAAGTVFSFPAPQVAVALGISLQGTNVTLTWSSTGYSLVTSTNVVGPYTNVSGAMSPYTVSPTNKARFFQLTN